MTAEPVVSVLPVAENNDIPPYAVEVFVAVISVLPSDVRAYYCRLIDENLKLLEFIYRNGPADFSDRDERTLGILKMFGALGEDRSLISKWASECQLDSLTPVRIARLNRKFNDICYGDNAENEILSGNAEVELYYPLLVLNAEVQNGIVDQIETDDVRFFPNLLPENIDTDHEAKMQIRKLTCGLIEYVTLDEGNDNLSFVNYHDHSAKPASQQVIDKILEKTNRKARSQFAFLHNRLYDMGVGHAGGLAGLQARVDEDDGGVLPDVMRQYKEAISLRTRLAKEARGVKADAIDINTVYEEFAQLAKLLKKQHAKPLADALDLLFYGVTSVIRLDPEEIISAPQDEQTLPYADRIAVGAVYALLTSDRPAADDELMVSINVGRINPTEIEIPDFEPAEVWARLKESLSNEDEHRFLFYIQGAITAFDDLIRAVSRVSAG